MSKGKNNKISNNKNQSPAVKSKQLKTQKPILNTKVVEKKVALPTKSVKLQSKKPEIINSNKDKSNKPLKKANAPLKAKEEASSDPEDDDIDDIDLSDMESLDMDASEDDFDESGDSDFDDDDIVEMDDSDIEEIDSEGDIAYAEDDEDFEEDSEDEEEEKPAEPVKTTKKAETPKEAKKAETPKEAKKAEAPKEAKKAEAPKEAKKVEAPKEAKKVEAPKEAKKAEAPKEEKKEEAVKTIDAGSEAGKILIEMNKRKNAESEASIHISGLDTKVKSDDLKALLSNAVDVYLPTKMRKTTRMNRGYGFIKFANTKDANEALLVINGTKLFGKALVGTKFQCKKVYDDINFVNFSKLYLTSHKNKDITEELKSMFPNGVTIKSQNKAMYELEFIDKCDAMELFNKEKFSIGDNNITVNLSYGKVAISHNTIPKASTSLQVLKAGMKRSKPESDEEEATVKKVKIEIKTPEKKQPAAANTPEKKDAATKLPEKKESATKMTVKKEATTKTPEKAKTPVNNNKNAKNSTPKGSKSKKAGGK